MKYINDSYEIRISDENYSPIVFPYAEARIEAITLDGAQVEKGKDSIALLLLASNNVKKAFIPVNASGHFFYSIRNDNAINEGEVLGYIFTPGKTGEIFFWLMSENAQNIQLGEQIKLTANNRVIEGVVSIIIGDYQPERGQKIGIKLDRNINKTFLIPSADIKKIK